jgi:hypothetical protein
MVSKFIIFRGGKRRPNGFWILIVALFVSCGQTNTPDTAHFQNGDLADVRNVSVDSLDIDTSQFITNIPDSVRKLIYNISDSLKLYMDIDIQHHSNSQRDLNDIICNRLIKIGFHVDSVDNRHVASRRSFNKRELINWHMDTVITSINLWYYGKKYSTTNLYIR